jgi:1L-myo-inositol 1-phosphate cytidylyltransferase / CDP-L-myo-inositol myo-inositolphosphotransferase
MSETGIGWDRDLPGSDTRDQEGPSVPHVGVILAAGRSERLASVTGGGSKALVRLGGLSLIERAVRSLLRLGLDEVVVVVGYHAGPVAATVERIAPGKVRTVYADRWEDGNGSSLAAAEALVADEPLFMVVTADHLFRVGSLTPLLHAGRAAALVDRAPNPAAWREGTRVRLHEERAIAFSKDLAEGAIDCGAFLLTPAVFAAQRAAAAVGDHSLSGAVTALAGRQPVAAIALPADAWWFDVDTPEDLVAAKDVLRRTLTKATDGPVSRYLNRPLSSRLSVILAPLRIHPDVLSWVAFICAVAAGWLLGIGAGIPGAVLTHVASVLDGMDGEAARLQDRADPLGALLDGVLDRLSDMAILAGLAVWTVQSGAASPATGTILAVFATGASLLSMATKDRISALRLPNAPERGIALLLGGRDGRLLLVAIAALAGRPAWALVAVGATTGVSLVIRMVTVRMLAGHPSRP